MRILVSFLVSFSPHCILCISISFLGLSAPAGMCRAMLSWSGNAGLALSLTSMRESTDVLPLSMRVFVVFVNTPYPIEKTASYF